MGVKGWIFMGLATQKLIKIRIPLFGIVISPPEAPTSYGDKAFLLSKRFAQSKF